MNDAVEDLENIVDKVLKSIDESKVDVISIVENVEKGLNEIKNELQSVKERVIAIIDEVDSLERLDRSARYRLMVVSKEFNKYSEEDIKNAYDEARDVQVKLIMRKQEERILIEKRNELERRLKNEEELLERARHLYKNIDIAFKFIKDSLNGINNQIVDFKNREELIFHIFRAQEEERQKIAIDLHDGPAQDIANLLYKVEICQKLMSRNIDEAMEELEDLKQSVKQCIRDLRGIIYGLKPHGLSELGFIAALKTYISDFEMETGINTEFTVFGIERRLGDEIETALFRISQECLSNIKKHSKAKNAYIRCEYADRKVTLIIKDDGVGFNTEVMKDSIKDHYGLMGIKERVALLDGNFNIESSTKGTIINVNIPLNGGEL
ncbi:MAG: sensor histidine kinase [Thermoanaerobacteraceae bacterium]|nr:sensor histidine kinase [Thermoanaerobacteraceae bacterium]